MGVTLSTGKNSTGRLHEKIAFQTGFGQSVPGSATVLLMTNDVHYIVQLNVTVCNWTKTKIMECPGFQGRSCSICNSVSRSWQYWNRYVALRLFL